MDGGYGARVTVRDTYIFIDGSRWNKGGETKKQYYPLETDILFTS